jgi:hypothetical protein
MNTAHAARRQGGGIPPPARNWQQIPSGPTTTTHHQVRWIPGSPHWGLGRPLAEDIPRWPFAPDFSGRLRRRSRLGYGGGHGEAWGKNNPWFYTLAVVSELGTNVGVASFVAQPSRRTRRAVRFCYARVGWEGEECADKMGLPPGQRDRAHSLVRIRPQSRRTTHTRLVGRPDGSISWRRSWLVGPHLPVAWTREGALRADWAECEV